MIVTGRLRDLGAACLRCGDVGGNSGLWGGRERELNPLVLGCGGTPMTALVGSGLTRTRSGFNVSQQKAITNVWDISWIGLP